MRPTSTPRRFTVFGGAGFIGSHLVTHLRSRGHECQVPSRDEVLGATHQLGHVVYCIGLTADFRSRPFDTVDAHIGLFASLLRDAQFDSLLYLSSARPYQSSNSGEETTSFTTNPCDPSQLYNLSKLTAECLCLSVQRPEIRIARLSNVYGPDFQSENFLASILRDAVQKRVLQLELHPSSAKDYVDLADVNEMLELIALDGRHRIYNVASGQNVSNGEIAAALRNLTDCAVEWASDARVITAPSISIERLRQEFGYVPRQLSDQLPSLVRLFRQQAACADAPFARARA